MVDDRSSDDFSAALQHLLDQVDWTPVEGEASDPAAPDAPYITHEGVLAIPGIGSLPCYQLNTGERVFDAETLERLFGLDAEDEEDAQEG